MAQQNYRWDFIDRPRAQVTKDRAFTLTAEIWKDNAQLVPSAGTITILGPGGSSLPDSAVSGAAVSVDGNGTMTYSFTAANAANLDANYTAEWNATVSGVVYDAVQLFDVVRFPLYNSVNQADLVKYYPDLADTLFSGESDFQAYIEQAFEEVYAHLDNKGKRPYLVLSREDLRRPTEHLALQKIFQSRRKEIGDKWDIRFEFHRLEYHRWVSETRFVYDEDESGTADGTSSLTPGSGEEGHGGGWRWRI